jgi:chromosome segregation ATPase
MEKRHQAQVKQLEANCSGAEEELKDENARHSKVIQDLTFRNDALTTEVALLKNHLEEIKAQTREQRAQQLQQSLLVPDIKKSCPSKQWRAELDEAKQNASELSQKLAVSEVQRDALAKNIERAERENAQLLQELEKQKSEVGGLQSANREMASEAQSLREQLWNRTQAKQAHTGQKYAKKWKSKIDSLQDTIRQQEETIEALKIEKESDEHRVEQLGAKVESIKEEGKHSKDQLRNLQSQLDSLRRQSPEKPAPSAEDPFPIHAWRCNDFDTSLAKEIEQIALNGVLQPSSKLSQIYRVIHAHYSEQLKRHEQMTTEVNEELQRVRTIVNQFVIDLSLSLCLGAAGFDDLIYHGWNQKIIQKVKQTVQSVEDLRRLNHQLEGLSQHIVAQFGESPDIFARISDVRATLDKQCGLMKAKKSKIAELRAKLRDLRTATTHEIDRLNADNSALTGTIEHLQNSAAQSAEGLKKLRAELNSAKQGQKESEISASQLESLLKSDHSRIIENLTKDHELVQHQLKTHIAELTAQLEKALETIATHESSIRKLKTSVQSNQRIAAEKTAELTALHSAHEEELAVVAKRARAERDRLVENYESTIADLRRQCDSLGNDVTVARSDISDIESANHKLKAAVSSLKRKKALLQDKLRAAGDKFEQEAKLKEAVLKSSTINAESACSHRLHEMKVKFEAEKHRLFALASDEFRSFFSPTDRIDEQTYRALLGKVRTELRRLTESDAVIRRLVAANPRQTTDDAVAQFLISGLPTHK